MAIASARDRLDKLGIVWFDCRQLQEDQQKLRDTSGRTLLKDLAQQHVDVCNLGHKQLGKVAMHIASALEKNQLKVLPRNRIKQLLETAVKERRIDGNRLGENVKKKLDILQQK